MDEVSQNVLQKRKRITRKYWFLCAAYFISSLERGILPAVLEELRDHLNLGEGAEGKIGSLPSFFLSGLMVSLPIFAALQACTNRTFFTLSIGTYRCTLISNLNSGSSKIKLWIQQNQMHATFIGLLIWEIATVATVIQKTN